MRGGIPILKEEKKEERQGRLFGGTAGGLITVKALFYKKKAQL